MPYIEKSDRGKFQDILDILESKLPEIKNAGELNYFITSICHIYLKQKGLKYKNINELVGVLECAKLELYRKVASPYEDEKAKLNGEVGEI